MAWDDGNFLTQILGDAESMDPSFMHPSAPRPAYAPQPAPMGGPSLMQKYEASRDRMYADAGAQPRRQRASVVDIIGGLLDSFAEIDGSKGQYQSTIDARNERQRQAESDQMTRELFPIEKQKGQLGNQRSQQEMTLDQNKVLGQVSSMMGHALQTQGVNGARNVWNTVRGRLGMTAEQLAQADAEFEANPEAFVTTIKSFAEGKSGAKYGTTPRLIVNPETQETRWIQVSDAGGFDQIQLPPGFIPDPRIQIEDTGLGFQGISKNNAVPYGTPVNKTGDLSQGITLTTPPGGGAPVVAPIQGGKQDLELTKDVRELQTLDDALTSFEGVFPTVRNNIDEMARAGSLSGIPEGAVDAQGAPLVAGGGNIKAIAMQNVPYLEQATNDRGFSAREQIMSSGRVMIQQLGPLLTQAQNSGANLTSRMMDTPKELEGLLAQVINTKDYKTAVLAYENFKKRYDTVRSEIKDKVKAAQSRTAQGRQQAPQPSSPNRIRYDAQGNRIQ